MRVITIPLLAISPLAMAVLVCLIGLAACSHDPYPGPDKQFAGSLEGAVTGAGAGAVTGFQVGAGTGPGAAVGAGFGAVAGGIQGFVSDKNEDNLLMLSAKTRQQREVAYAQEVLNEHYKRRAQLHPSRDIFPADLFFYGDDVKLRPEALPLIREIAHMNKQRLSWSRLVVASYVKSTDPESTYAKHLADRRSREICDFLTSNGIEPRRLETRAVIVTGPVLIDPHDRKDRYSQALEFIPVDR